ncbi:hypothetical protein C4D60_Mb07t11000 [Musa balbisiana]|uniref:EF-hand domain-containing protein n=1 Tax=Musa balbisiana TaxID=52838 RepID=A0A4S8JGD7_MUSBA|nr:hypothetical protein C4D60_Mb07t11000 [Musa balbisiana]
MGQLFSSIRGKTDSHDDRLTFQDLYIAVLYAYKYHLPALSHTLSKEESMMTPFLLLAPCSDINKFLPGPHNDPPSKEKLKAMMEEYDINLDGLLDREEFAELMRKLTADTVRSVGQNLLIGLVLVPTIALLAKRATEGVPVVGKVAQRTPNFVYASIVALGVVLVQKPNC